MGLLAFRVFLYRSAQMRRSLASHGIGDTAGNGQNKNLISQRSKPSGRYGKPVQGSLASSRPAHHSQSVVSVAQEQHIPDLLPNRSKGTGNWWQNVTSCSRAEAVVSAAVPPNRDFSPRGIRTERGKSKKRQEACGSEKVPKLQGLSELTSFRFRRN